MLAWGKKHTKYSSVEGKGDKVDETKKTFIGIRVRRVIGLRKSILSPSSCASTTGLSENDASSVSSTWESKETAFESEFLRPDGISKQETPSKAGDKKIQRYGKLECLPEHSQYDDAHLCHASSTHHHARTRNECGICSEPVIGPRFVGACLPCGHFFHEDCFFGSWASTLLHDIDEGNGKLPGGSISAHCLQCGTRVQDFGRMSINVRDAMGPTDAFEQRFNERTFQKIISKAKMVSIVRRCISGPSSPKMVVGALRVLLERMRRSNGGDSCEPGKSIKAEFLAVGGHIAMMQAVSRYPESEDICPWVNSLMAEVSVGHADVLFLTTPNLAGFVASSMRKYPGNHSLLTNGCCTFSELCNSNFAKQALQDIYKANGLGEVTDAIARFPLETSNLQWNAISFLVVAAKIDPMLICEHVSSETEAFVCIISALHETAASSSDTYGRLVCELLMIATRRPAFRGIIIKSGGAAALQALYKGSSDVQCKKMSQMILCRLGRSLHPENMSSLGFI